MAKRPTISQRIFQSSLLIAASVVLVYVTLNLLADVWGWLVFIASLVLATAIFLSWRRRQRDRW